MKGCKNKARGEGVEASAVEEMLTRDIISQVEEVDTPGGDKRSHAQLARRGKNGQCKRGPPIQTQSSGERAEIEELWCTKISGCGALEQLQPVAGKGRSTR